MRLHWLVFSRTPRLVFDLFEKFNSCKWLSMNGFFEFFEDVMGRFFQMLSRHAPVPAPCAATVGPRSDSSLHVVLTELDQLRWWECSKAE